VIGRTLPSIRQLIMFTAVLMSQFWGCIATSGRIQLLLPTPSGVGWPHHLHHFLHNALPTAVGTHTLGRLS
jgi:hypothetical protein